MKIVELMERIEASPPGSAPSRAVRMVPAGRGPSAEELEG